MSVYSVIKMCVKSITIPASSAVLILSLFAVNASAESYFLVANQKSGLKSENLNMGHVRNVFLLNKKKWRAGLKSKPIYPEQSSAQYQYLLKSVLKMSNAQLNRHWLQIKQRTGTSAPQAASSDYVVLNMVAASEGGIGIVSSISDLPDGVVVVKTF